MKIDDEIRPLVVALKEQFEFLGKPVEGGMSIVCHARDLKLDRDVAIKILPNAMAQDGSTRARFVQEARTAAKLRHSNIVPIYRADEAAGIAYFVMAYIRHTPLVDSIQEHGPFSESYAAHVIGTAARALAYAHKQGVVHRDVKPDNILCELRTHQIFVTDFGIAGTLDADGAVPPSKPGYVRGTLPYMSPEQCLSEPLDGRSDIYSLGAVGFYLLTGRPPFKGSEHAIMLAHARLPAPDVRSLKPNLSLMMADIIDRCLRKRPEDRFQNADALARACARCEEAEP